MLKQVQQDGKPGSNRARCYNQKLIKLKVLKQVQQDGNLGV